MQPGIMVALEGIISSGKSTYATKIGGLLEFRIFQEPLKTEHLKRFYKNPKKYAWHFQVAMLHERAGVHMLAAYETLYGKMWKGCIVDRTLIGDAAFAMMHAEEGNIEKLDIETYLEIQLKTSMSITSPTLLVFLDVSPKVALRRLKRRLELEGRAYEDEITLNYLEALRDQYYTLIDRAKRGHWPWTKALEVEIVPWDKDIIDEEEWTIEAKRLHNSIENIMNETRDGWSV